jgi:hypothetical protein
MAKCLNNLDSSQCDLVVDEIHATFGSFIQGQAILHHSIEIKVRCIECDRYYYFTKSDLKVEEFGQLWRTAVFAKEFKP